MTPRTRTDRRHRRHRTPRRPGRRPPGRARVPAAAGRARPVPRAASSTGAEWRSRRYDDATRCGRRSPAPTPLFLVSAAEHPRAGAAAPTPRSTPQRRPAYGRVVYTSFLGAAAGRDVHARPAPLADRAAAARARPRRSPSCATASTSTSCRSSPATEGSSAGPAGDGAFAPVARDDVADVAAAVLLDATARTTAQAYDVTGGRLRDDGRVGRRAVGGHRPAGRLRRRDDRGGLRLAGAVRRARLGGRGLGHVVRSDRRRRAGRRSATPSSGWPATRRPPCASS